MLFVGLIINTIGIVQIAKKKQSTTFAGSRIECPEKQKHDFGHYK